MVGKSNAAGGGARQPKETIILVQYSGDSGVLIDVTGSVVYDRKMNSGSTVHADLSGLSGYITFERKTISGKVNTVLTVKKSFKGMVLAISMPGQDIQSCSKDGLMTFQQGYSITMPGVTLAVYVMEDA